MIKTLYASTFRLTWSTQTGREWETSAGPFVDVFFRKTNPAHLERYVAWLVVQAVRRISPSSDARRELWKVSLGFRVWMHFSSERDEDARMHFQGDRERPSLSPFVYAPSRINFRDTDSGINYMNAQLFLQKIGEGVIFSMRDRSSLNLDWILVFNCKQRVLFDRNFPRVLLFSVLD